MMPRWQRPVFRGMLVVLSLCAVVVVLFCISALFCRVPEFSQIRGGSHGSDASLLDRNGQLLETLRLDMQRRQLEWVSLADISPPLLQAVVVAEDHRFYRHFGVDPLALIAAFTENFYRSNTRGGSTISMQLGSLLMQQAHPVHAHKRLGEKLQQIRYALALELHWNKREILEAYLNTVPFRGELVGVSAASYGQLAKGASGVNRLEAALLASMIRAPSARSTMLAKRACATLKQMNPSQSQANQSEACDSLATMASMLPSRPYPMPGLHGAPHLARHLLHSPGQRLRVSLDADLQRYVYQILHTQIAELIQQNVEDGAVVVLDNASGEVLAYVGSSGELSSSPQVDGVTSLRQPGSTLKPFLYAKALDQGWLNASSLLDDSPLALTTPSGLYIPQDYDRHFHGAVSVRTALGSSLNVPAVRTLTLVGVDQFLSTLHQLGLHSLTQAPEHYGYGLALGGGEITLLQLSNAYRALANGGLWSAVHFLPGEPTIEPARRVFSPQASFVISDILSDPAARNMTFGFSSPLSARTWAAVKTGTSKAMRDNWAIGYTDRYTIGVWVGNFSGDSMWDVSGITGAAPIWHHIVGYLHRNKTSRGPSPPDGVILQEISYQPPVEAQRREWVIKQGNQIPPAQIHLQIRSQSAMLIAPPDSAIIAPDPDIPMGKQRLLLQSTGQANTCLRLNNAATAACGVTKHLIALPKPGNHTLTLTDLEGKVLDTHRFQIRPAHNTASNP